MPSTLTEAAEARPPLETAVEIDALLADVEGDKADAIRARHALLGGRKTVAELIQEYDDEADDESSLLMGLEPEVAQAVRVKFRLYNGRKTLREVIAEVEAAPTHAQADKKSWWRR
ncbi:MAG TPA: hypothetical protein VNT79_01180 [Phycisphaerae bacterium]|nr:hypothetical protein [Phycisphaerae bacterium]